MMPGDRFCIALILATPGSDWGGMETHTRSLALGLSRQGHTVHLFAHPQYAEQFPKPLHFHAVSFQLGRRNPWLRFTLKRALSALKPDIIHAQGNKAASLVKLCRRKSAVTLGSIHGTKSSHNDYRTLDGVIGVSASIVASVDHANVRLIHNGVALPETRNDDQRHAIPSARPLILAAGRLEPVKQFDKLIRAFTQTSFSGCLVILGEGSQRPFLERLVRNEHLEDRVLLPGYETQLRPWFDAALACVISSQREGFPYLMVESLMAGCPVLSTPVSGVVEILPATAIADGTDIRDIANLLERWLHQPGDLRASQQQSFDRARSELSLNAMVNQTIDFYRQLLSQRQHRKD